MGRRVSQRAIRLIASDIDGTLIWRGALPAANRHAVQQAHAAGYQVVLATVRKYDSAKEIADLLGLAVPLICEGGATAYDAAGVCVKRIAIAADHMHALASAADALGIPLLMTSDGRNYATAGARSELSLFHHDIVAKPAPSARAIAAQHVVSRVIVAGAEQVIALQAAIAHLPLRIAVHYTRQGVLDDAVITAVDATKEQMLAWWAAQHGWDWQHILACGDAEADHAMVAAARIGIAPANATDAVRAAANWVGPLAEDGAVAHALQYFLGIPLRHE
ncbi:MAG: hypothetical protein RLZZ297_1439 [Chloroflexota bacterium]|jgi:Cof subfamily protein (haloacid dehalogenase superfamily)